MCVLCLVGQASTALHGYSPSTIFFFASLYISLEITPVSKSLWLICNSISLMHSLDNSYPDVIILRAPLIFLQMLGCKSNCNCTLGSFSAALIPSLLLVVRSKKKSPPIGITLPIGGIVVYLYMLQNREQLEQGTRCEITHFLRSFGSLIHFNFSVIFDFKSCDKNSISLISKATAFMGDLYPLIRILLGPII